MDGVDVRHIHYVRPHSHGSTDLGGSGSGIHRSLFPPPTRKPLHFKENLLVFFAAKRNPGPRSIVQIWVSLAISVILPNLDPKMPQEDPTKIPVHQPLYGTFSPIYPSSASIQSTPAFPPPGLSTPPPPSFYQNPQTYHAIPVGYQTYGAVVEGIPVREPRLPCCGIGIGWFLFLTGFFFAAVPWYVGAFILLFVVVDYREKAGLIACTIGAVLIAITVILGVSNENLEW